MNRLLCILLTLFLINGLVAEDFVQSGSVRAGEEADDSLYVVGKSDDGYDKRLPPVEEGCSAQAIVQTLQFIFTGNPLKALPDDVIFFYMVPGNRGLFVCRQKRGKQFFFFLSDIGNGFSALMPALPRYEFNKEWPCVVRDDVSKWGMFREPAHYEAPLKLGLYSIPEGNEPSDEEAVPHN